MTPSKELKEATQTYVVAMAWTQTVRPIVEQAQRDVLSRNDWRRERPKSDKFIELIKQEEERDGEFIRDPKISYMMSADNFQDYHNQVRAITEAAGLKTDHPDHCPLLVAENLERQAKQLLLDAACKSIPAHLTDKLNPELLNEYHNWKVRDKFIETTLNWVVPTIKNIAA